VRTRHISTLLANVCVSELRSLVANIVEMVQRLQLGRFSEEDPSLDEVRQGFGELIFDVCTGRNCKDVIQFFKSALFCLRNEEENHDQRNNVEATKMMLDSISPRHNSSGDLRIKAKGTKRMELIE
jgi:hypothetical protein